MRKQQSVKGRKWHSAGFIREVNAAIELTRKRFNCSRSFVISVGMAEFFGIKHESYVETSKTRLRRVK